MNGTNPDVDFFFDKEGQWQKAYALLRSIVLSSGLTEKLKWGVPCYTRDNANICLIHGFKEYCAVLFPKGALLQNIDGKMIQQTENVQAARQMRFTSHQQVKAEKDILKAFIMAAIEVEKAGLKVPMKKTREFSMPAEFKTQLDAQPLLKKAFEALTPGRQRAYLLHFSSAKQSATRTARVAKYIPQILEGRGIDD